MKKCEKKEEIEVSEVFEEEDEAVLLHELNRVEGQGAQALEEHVQQALQEPDLGQNSRSMCLDCVSIPCLCMLLKIDLKLDYLRKISGRLFDEEREEESEDMEERKEEEEVKSEKTVRLSDEPTKEEPTDNKKTSGR